MPVFRNVTCINDMARRDNGQDSSVCMCMQSGGGEVIRIVERLPHIRC